MPYIVVIIRGFYVVGIKFDLSGMIRQIEEFTKAVEKLGISTQSSLSNMAQSAGGLGRSVGSISSTRNQPTEPEFLTQTGNIAEAGRAQREAAAAAIQKANEEHLAAFQRNDPNYAVTAEGVLGKYATTSHGKALEPIAHVSEITKGAEERLARDKAREATKGTGKFLTEGPLKTPAAEAASIVNPVRMKPGYSLADIPSGLSAQKDAKSVTSGLESAIQKLGANLTDSNAKISADILKVLHTRIGEKEAALTKAKEEFAASPNEVASQNKLVNAIAELTEAMEDGTRAEKESQRMQGGGGEPPKKGIADWMQDKRVQYGAAVLAGTHLIATGAQQYLGAQITARNAVIGQELKIQQNIGATEQLRFKRAIESVDMSSGENILKYHGDMFYKGARGSEYLGAKGFQRANEEAFFDHKRTEERDREQRSQGRIGALKDIGIGVGAIVGSVAATLGSGGVATGLGIAGGLYGASQIASGVGGLFQNEMTSAASAREGITGLTGAAAKTLGLSENELSRMRTARLTEDQVMMDNYSEGLRNAQVQQHAKDAFLIDKQLEAKSATRAAVQLVGRYALTPKQLIDTIEPLEKKDQEFYDKLDRTHDVVKSGFNRARIRGVTLKTQKTEPQKTEPQKTEPKTFMDGFGGAFSGGLVGNDENVLGLKGATSGIGPFASGAKYAKAADDADLEALRKTGINLTKRTERAPREQISTWASYGMSQAEWISKTAEVTNIMSDLRPDRSKKDAAEVGRRTSRLLDMGYAGLGSQEQILGNVAALNNVTGQADNTSKLTQIMAQAVALGFDKSRTGQQFIGAVTDLSRSLGITETGAVGKSLALGASIMSATGTPNELSLAAAQKGMGEYAAYTSQTGGFVGAMKMRAAFGSGMSFGGGAGILSGKSAQQEMSWLSELSTGKITSVDLQDLLTLQTGTKDEKIAKVKKSLEGQISAAGTQVRGQFDVTHGRGAYSSMIESIKSTKEGSKERQAELLKFRAYTNEAAAQVGIGSEAAMAAGMQTLQMSGAVTAKEAYTQLEANKKAGKEMGIDPAARNLQKYIDENSKQFNKTNNAVDEKTYKEYLKAGGVGQIRVGSGKDEKEVTLENIGKLTDTEKKEFKDKVNALTTVDLAQGAEQAYSQTGNVQRVEITNWRGMSQIIAGTKLGERVDNTKNVPK